MLEDNRIQKLMTGRKTLSTFPSFKRMLVGDRLEAVLRISNTRKRLMTHVHQTMKLAVYDSLVNEGVEEEIAFLFQVVSS